MKTKSIYQGIALLVVALTTAACQNELNEDTTQPKTGEKVNMIIRATQGMAPQTRTIYEDKLGVGTTGKIEVKWEGGVGGPEEEIQVVGYTDGASEFTDAGTLKSTPSSLSTDGFSITFTGDVTAVADKYLAVYPAVNSSFDVGYVYFDFFTDAHSQTQDCNNPMAHLKEFDIMIGKPAATGTNNYTFLHKTIMLRFDLTLSQEESVNKITLNTTGKGGIAPYAFITMTKEEGKEIDDLKIEPLDVVPEVSLGIKKHNASTLKAYMTVPYIDVDNALLTITVNTNSGNTYEGKLTTVAGTKLTPGLCYTLNPNKLTPTNKIIVPPVTSGGLGSVLDNLKPNATQTELAVSGTVNDADITNLVTFLKDETKSKNITLLDLSGITNVTEVKGFAACTKVTTVILPASATAIGDKAFEGCTALTTVIESELPKTKTAVNTRASMPSRVRTVGASAFAGCTSMTEMFLHANITSVGANAFQGCTALKALVFEGDKEAGSASGNITLGTDIVAGTDADLKIFLPTIIDATTVTTYKTALAKSIYYDFKGYGSADAENKVNTTNYTLLPHGNGLDEFTPGNEWGK